MIPGAELTPPPSPGIPETPHFDPTGGGEPGTPDEEDAPDTWDGERLHGPMVAMESGDPGQKSYKDNKDQGADSCDSCPPIRLRSLPGITDAEWEAMSLADRARLVWDSVSPALRSILRAKMGLDGASRHISVDSLTVGEGLYTYTEFYNPSTPKDPAYQATIGPSWPLAAVSVAEGDGPPSGICLVAGAACGEGVQITITLNTSGLHFDAGEIFGTPQVGAAIGLTTRSSDFDGFRQLMSDFGQRIDDGLKGISRLPESFTDFLSQRFTFSPFPSRP
jgi:hypothetical protein